MRHGISETSPKKSSAKICCLEGFARLSLAPHRPELQQEEAIPERRGRALRETRHSCGGVEYAFLERLAVEYA